MLDDSACEINVDEFLIDNSDKPQEGSSSNIYLKGTGESKNPREAEHPTIIEPVPMTSAYDHNAQNVIDTHDEEEDVLNERNTLTPRNVNLSQFTEYLIDGRKPQSLKKSSHLTN